MYSGFITHRYTSKRLGIHQRFDRAAYGMVHNYFAPGSFPSIKQILNFEGLNGPDGLKVKSPGKDDPDHFYDPIADKGDLPGHVKGHFESLVDTLGRGDMVRSAFEASWLAHYVVDGLSPAHHTLIEDEMERIHGGPPPPVRAGFFKYVVGGEGMLKKNWMIWGAKGVVSTHHNFEVGMAAAMLGRPLRVRLDPVKLARAREVGYMTFFKEESLAVAKLDLYAEFQKKGWSSRMAASVRNRIAPAAIQTAGIIWLLAYLEAGLKDVKKVAATAVA